MCLLEFLHFDNFSIPGSMPFAYLLLILIYVLRKEVDRWLRRNTKKRRGELFVIGWWLTLLMMFIVEFSTHSRYCVSKRMMETCILVLLPYIGTIVSKIAFFRLENGNTKAGVKPSENRGNSY
ncbi:MAG: hypothetical protein WCV50_00735 [Patescibacteria group bacterium]|jgi:hypothetical protein